LNDSFNLRVKKREIEMIKLKSMSLLKDFSEFKDFRFSDLCNENEKLKELFKGRHLKMNLVMIKPYLKKAVQNEDQDFKP